MTTGQPQPRFDHLTMKVLRISRRMAQQDLAEQAGISPSFLCELEAGKKQPSPAVLGALADALGVNELALIGVAK